MPVIHAALFRHRSNARSSFGEVGMLGDVDDDGSEDMDGWMSVTVDFSGVECSTWILGTSNVGFRACVTPMPVK